jgi:protein-tyrosine phosphatase
MNLYVVESETRLYFSPVIEDWEALAAEGITVVIDLEGGLDHGCPTLPNHMLYVYFPIYDEDLPDRAKLHAVARLGASLVQAGHKVLCHCGMGFNRSALMAGLILIELGVCPGHEAVSALRRCRPGALFNEVFAAYLASLPEE